MPASCNSLPGIPEHSLVLWINHSISVLKPRYGFFKGVFKDVMLHQEAWSISKQGCLQVAATGGLLRAEAVGDLCLLLQVTSFSLTLWMEGVSCPLGSAICLILCFIWVPEHQGEMLLMV